MKIVVDTNVVISAILNRTGKIGKLLILGGKNFTFYAPSLMKEEIKKHKTKLLSITNLSDAGFDLIREELFECLTFISEEQIPYAFWHTSLQFVREVDIDDIAFVALSGYLDAHLWTGDKKLLTGINKQGFEKGLTTDDLYRIWVNFEDNSRD